jgi:photosystem II stability/assembly factor-like uncharacterized protein
MALRFFPMMVIFYSQPAKMNPAVTQVFLDLRHSHFNLHRQTTYPMKKSFAFLCCFFLSFPLYSQNAGKNFEELRQRFYEYYDQKKNNPGETSFAEYEEGDGLLKKFKRWEWLMQTRLMPDGTLPASGLAARERKTYLEKHPEQNILREATWTQVGSLVVPSNGGGAGRVNVIKIDPTNSNTIYIGTASGGVWKTTNGGTSWSPITDQASNLSIADIAIDATNTNNLYLATGDGYGYEFGQVDDFWGGLYSSGVLHSTDGGATWNTTGLSYDQSDNLIIQRLVIDPSNPQNLLAATRNGISLSTDGGATWTQTLSGHYYDIEYNTANSSTVYCAGNNNLYQSSDGGATWSTMKTSVGNDRISIEVSAANPQVIYALAIGGSFWKSTDGGANWSVKTYPSGASFYGYYDGVLTCSGADSEFLVAGGFNAVKSTNGGTSWTTIGNSIHVDHHAFAFVPGSTSNFYSGNDGGIFKTTNSGSNWTDISSGLAISQIYRLASSASDPNIIYSGWQDNGSNRWNGNTNSWSQVYGADGMDCMIDFNTAQNVYISYQYGGLQRSTNGGSNFTYIAPCSGNWITPFEMDPVTSSTLYAGCASIYRSTNSGTSWTNIGSNLFTSGTNNACEDIAIAPSNVNTIYACSFNKIVKTTTGGSPWTTITGTLPTTNTGINQIAVSNTDPNDLWICLGGYTAGSKVFRSEDAGATWVNMSGTLPNLPVNSIVYEHDSPDRLYIGTDIGVYYSENNSDWVYYNSGLPNVMVHELEINYTNSQLLAGTYGRGIWTSDLVTESSAATISTDPVVQNPVCQAGDVSISYTASGTFNAGNIFTAQLSNGSGSFSSPTTIGTLSSTASGVIACTIPSSANGTGYRIRVISDNPAVTGSDNGTNLVIQCVAPASLSSSGISATSATVSWLSASCAVNYNLQYRQTGTSGWTKKNGIAATSYLITGLAPSTSYQWKVKTKCVKSPAITSGFSAVQSFTTLPVKLDDEAAAGEIEIYPNPSGGVFEIRCHGEVTTATVYDLAGKKRWIRERLDGVSQFGINLQVPAGVYFIEMKTTEGVITRQITVE